MSEFCPQPGNPNSLNCDSAHCLILAHVGTLGMWGLGMVTELFFLEFREAAFMHNGQPIIRTGCILGIMGPQWYHGTSALWHLQHCLG